MKRISLMLGAALCTISALAQPQLRTDNIDEVMKAMTLEEKATLLVGSGWGSMVGGLTGSDEVLVSVADIRASVPFKVAKAQSWPVHRVMLPKEPVQEIKVK